MDAGRATIEFSELTTLETDGLLSGDRVPVLLLPVGTVEPHGPHAPLGTDVLLATEVCERTARALADASAAGRFDVELYPAAVKHASQMKYGDARGARFLLTLDDDGTMSVKDMESGERASAAPADVPALLSKLAGTG